MATQWNFPSMRGDTRTGSSLPTTCNCWSLCFLSFGSDIANRPKTSSRWRTEKQMIVEAGQLNAEPIWMRTRRGVVVAAVFALASLVPLPAAAVGIFAPNTAEYILVGTGPQSTIGTSTAVSNFELGANTSAVPMSGLAGSVPALPGNAQTVFVGIGGNGDIANTHLDGNFDLSNIDVWGDTGIDCSGPLSSCNTGLSNTNFNGAPMTTSNGLNGNVDLSAVSAELFSARATIPAFVADNSILLDFSSDGIWDTQLTINLLPGITVIDFITGGNDLLLVNENLLIDGPNDAFAIFRIPDEANFNVSQSNIVVGDSGIGLHNVLFYTDKPDNNQHVNVNDAIINGIAFWDLSMGGGEITFNNVQGCTQAVADKINLNDVRLNNCAFAPIPEPRTALLFAIGLSTVGLQLRGRRAEA